MIVNQVPGRLDLKLTTPFELVHKAKPYSKTWFELFSIDNTENRSKLKAHTLYGISVGRDDKLNSIFL